MLNQPTRFVLALLITACGASAGAAQEAAPASPDLSITGTIRARELKFETVPKTFVRSITASKKSVVTDVKRKNLPKEIQPGVTYRNVELQFTIHSFAEEIGGAAPGAITGEPGAPGPLLAAVKAPPPRPQRVAAPLPGERRR